MMKTQSERRWLRSLFAILAGFIVVVLAHVGTDALMHATGIFPPWGQPMSDGLFALATAYRSGWSILGSYITARLAPFNPMAHALAGACIGIVLSVAGTIATWNRGPEFGPHWYPIALIILALPCAWLGGKLQAKTSGKTA